MPTRLGAASIASLTFPQKHPPVKCWTSIRQPSALLKPLPGTQVLFIILPAADRTRIELAADLLIACGPNRTRRRVEFQAALIEREIAEVEHAPHSLFRILEQILIALHVYFPRKHLVPV